MCREQAPLQRHQTWFYSWPCSSLAGTALGRNCPSPGLCVFICAVGMLETRPSKFSLTVFDSGHRHGVSESISSDESKSDTAMKLPVCGSRNAQTLKSDRPELRCFFSRLCLPVPPHLGGGANHPASQGPDCMWWVLKKCSPLDEQ